MSYIIIDFLILVGSILGAFFCIWRSHVNFTRGYIRLGYAYMLLFLAAALTFMCQAFLWGL